ncbi:hypothetical protein [Streptomyces sp. NPDC002133]|uniref:hypothetical protein n=1 Tax=Streptomyces sp. NPDC002133 TaxID=3154409 RepID=UPI003325D39B
MYDVWRRAELSKRLDVWSSYLGSRVDEGATGRRELEEVLAAARTAQAAGDLDSAEDLSRRLIDDAGEYGLPHAPSAPRPEEADAQVRDYVKDLLPEALSLAERDGLDRVSLFLRCESRRLRGRCDIDPLTRQDIDYVYARAWMALDLGQVEAANRELVRLRDIAASFPERSP